MTRRRAAAADANVMTRPCLKLALLLWCLLESGAEAATSSATLSLPTLSTVIQAPEGTRSALRGFGLTLIGSGFGNKAPQAVSVAVSSFYVIQGAAFTAGGP